MCRIPFNSRLCCVDVTKASHVGQETKISDLCRSFFNFVGVCIPRPTLHGPLPIDLNAQHENNSLSDTICSHVHHLAMGGGACESSRMVVVTDDKDPSVRLVQMLDGSFTRWITVLHSQTIWPFTKYREQEGVHLDRGLLKACQPRSLVPNLDFFVEHPAYSYPTIKREYLEGTGDDIWSCNKPCDLCMRIVISFIKLPGRTAFKAVCRATRCIPLAIWPFGAFLDGPKSGP